MTAKPPTAKSKSDPYGAHLRSAVEHGKRIREALINGSVYVDEVNRERDRYLAGLITVEELELRIGRILKERDDA